jgi:hypothetical protein
MSSAVRFGLRQAATHEERIVDAASVAGTRPRRPSAPRQRIVPAEMGWQDRLFGRSLAGVARDRGGADHACETIRSGRARRRLASTTRTEASSCPRPDPPCSASAELTAGPEGICWLKLAPGESHAAHGFADVVVGIGSSCRAEFRRGSSGSPASSSRLLCAVRGQRTLPDVSLSGRANSKQPGDSRLFAATGLLWPAA